MAPNVFHVLDTTQAVAEISSSPLSPDYIWRLSLLATSGLAFMWLVFWVVVKISKESVTAILVNPSFFRTTTVMGVIAATVVLSLAGRLEGHLTGAIVSGIVGYVLGTKTSRDRADHGDEGKGRDSSGKK